MSNVAPIRGADALALTGRQVALVKHTIAKDCNDDEFDLYMAAARSYGLDPFRKQIIPLVFGKAAKDPSKRRMSIVVSRDGLRVIAQRCGNYRPASEKAEWETDPSLVGALNPKGLVSCTVYLWQQDNRGEWFRVKGEAEWDEFAPVAEEWGDDPATGRRRPTGHKVLDSSGNWARMPKVMLEKCAEAQALRAGWPEQFGGLYVEEEMAKASFTDMTASEIVEHEAEERRLRMIGGGDNLTVTWDVGFSLDPVPLDKFADRVIEHIRDKSPDEIAKFQSTNAAPLREFWAKRPTDALELKRIMEKAVLR